MQWFKIFTTEEDARKALLANKPRLVIIDEKRITLVRHNEIFFAVQDRCTHLNDSLSKGIVNHLGEIVCPWHNYRFDLKSGKACDHSCPDLDTYAIKVNYDGFFIGF